MNEHFLLFLLFMAGLFSGIAIGLLAGRRIWGSRWFDTSEGIDRKFRSMKRF